MPHKADKWDVWFATAVERRREVAAAIEAGEPIPKPKMNKRTSSTEPVKFEN